MQLLDLQTREMEFENGRLYAATGPLGLGLFAGTPIGRGERILVFQGSIIGFQEAVAKGDRECWPLQICPDKYLDLEMPGCLANHSCEPNSGVRDHGNISSVELVALRDISPGEEIRYDYSTTMDEDSFTMPCRCGSNTCRGVVQDFKYLLPETQHHYLNSDLVMKFVFERLAQPPQSHLLGEKK